MHEPRAPVDALSDVKLTGQQRTIVQALAKAYPRAVSRDGLFNALYGLDPNGGPDDVHNSISVRLTLTRKRLEPYGWTITKGKGGNGMRGIYKLEPLETAA